MMILRLMLFGLALALSVAAQSLEDGSYTLDERCWLRYEADGQTLGLFHLDSAEATAEDSLDSMSIDDFVDAPADEPLAPQPGGLHDSSIMPQPAKSQGLEPEPNGRIGDGLRFPATGDASLCTPTYGNLGGKGWQATAEAWFFLDKADDEATPLITYAMSSGHLLRVDRQPDGALAINWKDTILATTPIKTIPLNAWCHVALVVDRAAIFWDQINTREIATAIGAKLFVDGELALTLTNSDDIADRQHVPVLTELWLESGASIWFGSRPQGTSRMIGVIDELRVSSIPRAYYPWLPPAAVTPEPSTDAWPYLRDRGDLVRDITFESTQK